MNQVTIKNLGTSNADICFKRQDNSILTTQGLLPIGHTFEFTNNTTSPASFISAHGLSHNMSDTAVYLLQSQNGTFNKLTQNIAYEQTGQKLDINVDDLTGTVGYTLMTAQAPVLQTTSSYPLAANQAEFILETDQIATDPDSLSGDMVFQVMNVSNATVAVAIQNNELQVTMNGFLGQTSIELSVKHDGITVNKAITVISTDGSIREDLNGDGLVNRQDVALMVAQILARTNNPAFDLNNDNQVNVIDLAGILVKL